MSKSHASSEDQPAKPPSKSKAVKRAHKALVKALEAHTEIVLGGGVSLKKAQRAGAKVAAAAQAYADAVAAKAGVGSPFAPDTGRLDSETMQSLRAERTKLATGALPIVPAEPEAT